MMLVLGKMCSPSICGFACEVVCAATIAPGFNVTPWSNVGFPRHNRKTMWWKCGRITNHLGPSLIMNGNHMTIDVSKSALRKSKNIYGFFCLLRAKRRLDLSILCYAHLPGGVYPIQPTSTLGELDDEWPNITHRHWFPFKISAFGIHQSWSWAYHTHGRTMNPRHVYLNPPRVWNFSQKQTWELKFDILGGSKYYHFPTIFGVSVAALYFVLKLCRPPTAQCSRVASYATRTALSNLDQHRSIFANDAVREWHV